MFGEMPIDILEFRTRFMGVLVHLWSASMEYLWRKHGYIRL